jgi:predicted permease
MKRAWPPAARGVAAVLRRFVPGSVISPLLQDLDESYQRRCADSTARAKRWLTLQLVRALRPSRLRDLRRLPARALRGADDIGFGRAIVRGLAALGTDLRYSGRLLRGSPGFSLMTIVILTGGLSVSIFTFAFMNTVLHKPLPLPEGDAVRRVMAVQDGRSGLLDGDAFAFVRRNAQSFEVIGGYITRHVLLRGGEEPRPSFGTYVDPNMFDVVKVPPLHGRRLLPSDAVAGADPVAVLSHHVWSTAFGADPSIVGELVEMNTTLTRIVGVMPAGFGFPVFGHIWLPVAEDELSPPEGPPVYVDAYALLRNGVTAARADIELHEIMQRYRATIVDPAILEDTPQSATTRTFQKMQLGDEADLVFAMLHMASGFILLLACVNAGNMLLARSLERSREITIRTAIGAPRLRLVCQMMGEGMIIAIAAGGLATWIAARALTIFDARSHAALPDGLAYWWRWGMDGPTLTVALVLVGATIAIVGGVPAWRVVRADTNAALRDGQQGGQGLETDRLSRTLVVVQIAAIAVLLFLGSLTGYVAYRAGQIDLGVNTDRVLVGTIQLDPETYPTAGSRIALLERLSGSLRGSAVVEGVMVRAQVGGASTPIALDGVHYDSASSQPTARVRTHMGDSALIGLQLRAGRRLDERDGADAAPSALVSESLARALWPDSQPLGQQLRLGDVEAAGIETEPWYTVVGVVSDILEGNPLSRDRGGETLYVPMRHLSPAVVGVTFRHRGNPRTAVAAFYDAVAEAGPEVEPQRIMDFDEMFGQMRTMSIAALQVLGGCFGFALVLAIGGIYGLTARTVTQRTQEIGIRRALGATNARIIRLFLRGSGKQLGIGLGMASVVAATGTLAVLQFMELDVAALTAVAVGVPALITAFVMLATYLPARRAAQLNPRVAIWRE